MTERSELVQRLFLAACRLQGAERAQFLDDQFLGAERGTDQALRTEVEELLRLDAETPFLREDDLLALRSPLAAPTTLPEQIAGFRILGLLGSGGMGVVYRAQQEHPSRQVALKVLAPGLGDAAARARFELEAEALGRLQHPGIAQILQAGAYTSAAGQQPFLAMELIDCEALPDWVARAQPTTEARLQLLVEICAAVQHAHQKGIIHRDLKPGNVFVDRQGHAKVLDFGIARFVDDDRNRTLQTQTGQVLGTLAYMSPEQANGQHDRIDVRTDVYAIGVIGYELLTGTLPIDVQGTPFSTALRRLIEEEPRPLGVHDRRLRGDLQTIFAMALRKEPERRYGSAQAFAEDLQRFLAHEPIRARPATTLYVVQRFARRHRGLVAGAVLAALALLGGTTASLAWAMRADAAEQQSREEARVANQVTEVLRSLFSGANPELAAGRDLSAKEILRQGQGAFEKVRATDPVVASRLSLILGDVLISLGELTTADNYLQSAEAALRAAFPGDNPRRVEAMHVRAWGLLRASRFAEAAPLYADALAMHRRLGVTSEIIEAKCLEGSAQCAARAGHIDEALTLLTEARPLRERLADPVRLSLHWQNTGNVLQLGKRYAEAAEAYAKAEAVLPPTGNEGFAAALSGNLANLYLAQRKLPEAEAAFRKALTLAETCYGKDSPRLTTALSHLGALCGQSGRMDEALPLLQRAITVGGDPTVSADRGLANAFSNLGLLHATEGRLAEAVDAWQHCAAMEKRLRPGSRQHLEVLQNLAGAKEELGDNDGAAALRAEAAALRK